MGAHICQTSQNASKRVWIEAFLCPWPLHRVPASRRFIHEGFKLVFIQWKRSRRALGRQHKNLQQGEQEQQQKRGEDIGWGRGRGQPGGSLVSWTALCVRSSPHDLVMGGISHNGSQHLPLFYFLKQPNGSQLRSSECSAEELWRYKGG